MTTPTTAQQIIAAELEKIDHQIKVLQAKRHYWHDAMVVGEGMAEVIADLIQHPIVLEVHTSSFDIPKAA